MEIKIKKKCFFYNQFGQVIYLAINTFTVKKQRDNVIKKPKNNQLN